MVRENRELLVELLPSTRLWMHYGLSEASRSSFIEFHDAGKDKLDSIGRATVNVSIDVVDQSGASVGVGTPGMLKISGKHVAAGYLDDPAKTADTFDGEVISTGDMGFKDDDGYFWFLGRDSDFINSGGYNVSPLEVEGVLNTHPLVQESACVGQPDPRGISGDIVVAHVVPTDRSSAPDSKTLRAWVGDRLEAYKVPREIVIAIRLPRTASGKLKRDQLREA